jgi:hypothetical protein
MARLACDSWKVPYISLFDLTCWKDACDEYAGDGVLCSAETSSGLRGD